MAVIIDPDKTACSVADAILGLHCLQMTIYGS